MSPDDYLLPKFADEANLSAGASILPQAARVLRTSLFCDAFIVDDVGSGHMLERAGCFSCLIASSEEEFWRNIKDDEQGWQLRQLADDCRNSGKVLADGQCYAFTILPLLGGAYDADNVWIAPLSDCLPFTADLFAQIKNLPDGATVSLHVSGSPATSFHPVAATNCASLLARKLNFGFGLLPTRACHSATGPIAVIASAIFAVSRTTSFSAPGHSRRGLR